MSVTISAHECPYCHCVVFSRHRHDMRSCRCGAISVDGGRDYTKVSYDPLVGVPSVVILQFTNLNSIKQLVDMLIKDYYDGANVFGCYEQDKLKKAMADADSRIGNKYIVDASVLKLKKTKTKHDTKKHSAKKL